MKNLDQDIPEIQRCQIRAVYDNATIRVYQAYSDAIADSVLTAGTFVVPPFKMDRMTWIKPSFLWMMYRAGWGLKDAGQKRILAIDITRDGFNWALAHSCSTHRDESITKKKWQLLKESNPVLIQWDPERDLSLQAQSYRTIQIGLCNNAIDLYVRHWVQCITDVTPLAHRIHRSVIQGKVELARTWLPLERPYYNE